MAEKLVCPKCKHGFRLPAEHVGAKIPCPRCEFLVGSNEGSDEITVDQPPPQKAFKPCPRCLADGAQRVLFTAWGSFYGPALFNHVRCPECRCAYNGRSGRSNLVPAIIFVTIPALIIAGLLGFIAVVLYKAMT
jgi:hypothetical protein